MSAERSIGSRVSWGSSRTANERKSLGSNPCSRGSRDRALGSGPANKDDGRSSAAENQTPIGHRCRCRVVCQCRARSRTRFAPGGAQEGGEPRRRWSPYQGRREPGDERVRGGVEEEMVAGGDDDERRERRQRIKARRMRGNCVARRSLHTTFAGSVERAYSCDAISLFGRAASLRPARGGSRSRRCGGTGCLSGRSRQRPASCRSCGAAGAAAFRSGSHRPTVEAR